VKFWDSSAIVPLLVEQQHSAGLVQLLGEDPDVVVWWSTPTECASAIARLERDRGLDNLEVEAAFLKLDQLSEVWTEVLPTNGVRNTARRLLRTHPLRASDALQLAAALILTAPHAAKPPFVCLDDRLVSAARKEGFQVVLPGS